MSREQEIFTLLKKTEQRTFLLDIAAKVLEQKRISSDDCVALYEQASMGFAGTLANYVRQKLHGNIVYFNRNFHIEPTNLCVFTCKFCSYSRLIKQQDEGWVMTREEMLNIVRSYKDKPVTEVHIVGGVLPQLNLSFFLDIIPEIKKIKPGIHIKAFTAVELEYMFRKAKVSVAEGLQKLKDAGVDSLPGGGAEIFDEKIRLQICADKCDSQTWLHIHKTAHLLGMHSNATMLYGHIENYAHRAEHMERLRILQDETKGFNTFIPLKFRNKDNEMSYVQEVSTIEDLRNYSIARIYLDNIPHTKAYWPMIGRNTAQLSLHFGVNDIDGTIDDSTKIYTMAGAEEQHPVLSTQQIVELISAAGMQPVERDTLYNVVKDYTNYDFSQEPVSGYVNLPVVN